MAETPDQKQTIAGTSNEFISTEDSTTSDTSISSGSDDDDDDDESEQEFDFQFMIRPSSVLINAAAALGDTRFNPRQQAVIQVDKGGFEMTVRIIDSKTNKPVFGFLCLKASGLEEFECKNPLKKIISFEQLNRVLKAAAWYESTSDPVAVYVDHGSNKMSLQWDATANPLVFGHGMPISIDLKDLNYEFGDFPDVTYGFEAVIPSIMWRDTITELLQIAPLIRPTDAMVTLTAETVHWQLNNEVALSTTDKSETHDIWWDWQYWESLQKAALMANNCCMYLVTDPPQHIMLRFKLRDLGDFVYLTGAGTLAVGELPYLGDFHPVLFHT